MKLICREQLPSFHGGYADSAGSSEFPELWEGLQFAILPMLGPTGNVLHDFGPCHHWAYQYTGNNLPITVDASLGTPCLDWTSAAGGCNIVNPTHPPAGLILPQLTVVGTIYCPSANWSQYATVFGCGNGANNGWWLQLGSSATPVLAWPMTTGNAQNATVGPLLTKDAWVTFVARYNGLVQNIDLYKQDGSVVNWTNTLSIGGAISYGTLSNIVGYIGTIAGGLNFRGKVAGLLVYGRDIGAHGSLRFRSPGWFPGQALPFYRTGRYPEFSAVVVFGAPLHLRQTLLVKRLPLPVFGAPLHPQQTLLVKRLPLPVFGAPLHLQQTLLVKRLLAPVSMH